MTAITADQAYDAPTQPERGSTTLDTYIRELARCDPGSSERRTD